MKIVSAEFIAGAVSDKQYPPGNKPELAFVGRSNVGKSSLINSLLNRKKLVKTSSTPGKTQMINFFNINDDMVFVDLPGYGFAKVPLKVKQKWKQLIENYLLRREILTGVVLIIDARRDPTSLDIDMKNWLEASGINYILAATKTDKLTRVQLDKQMRKISAKFFGKESAEKPIAYSSKNSKGRNELWTQVLRLTTGEP